MNKPLSDLTLSQVYDLLAEVTVRYNHILLHGGMQDEFKLLADCLELIQAEIYKRRSLSHDQGPEISNG